MKSEIKTGVSRSNLKRTAKNVLLLSLLAIFAIINNLGIDDVINYRLRPDTYRYWNMYEEAATHGFWDFLFLHRWEAGYTAFSWAFSNLGIDFWWFIFAVKFLLLAAYLRLSLQLVGSRVLALAATGLFTLTFFGNYTENLIRQGVALALLLFAIIGLAEDKWRRFGVWALVAILFHTSAILLFGLAFLASRRWRLMKSKWLLLFTAVIAAAYVANLWLPLIVPFARVMEVFGLRYTSYASLEANYIIGFKPLFLTASVVLILASFAVLTAPPVRHLEVLIIRFGLLTTCAYMIMSGFPYYDRVASVSWILVPIIGLLAVRKWLARLTKQMHSMR